MKLYSCKKNQEGYDVVPMEVEYVAALRDRSEINSYVITLGNLNKQAFIDLILLINHET